MGLLQTKSNIKSGRYPPELNRVAVLATLLICECRCFDVIDLKIFSIGLRREEA
ncbi:hypothetical protein GFS31_41560 (plasmid) [Leptolyngbya sp. BL0902]|nr:hypothetical protein GFS31_41560 [Leptolyngbya sp. BL0902]